MCVKLLAQNLNNLVCFTIILNNLIRIIFYLVIILIVIILINFILIIFIFLVLIILFAIIIIIRCCIVVITSVIVESNFNSIELTRSILILKLGKFPSLTRWGERRMRVKCSIQLIRSRNVTWRVNYMRLE